MYSAQNKCGVFVPSSCLGCPPRYNSNSQPRNKAFIQPPRKMAPTKDVAVPQESKSVGIIGMGDMGKMYARRIAKAGWRSVYLTNYYCHLIDR